jgi:hypothetical protein
MSFTIEQLIDDRNRALHDEVAAQVRIELREEPEPEEGWGSQYRAKESCGIIFHAPTPYPQACFAHELLHIKYEANGYRRPMHAVSAPVGSMSQDDLNGYRDWVGDFFVFVYNQLMHHKMYPDFIALGYPPNEFFRDEPGRLDRLAARLADLKEEQRRSPNDLNAEYFAKLFFALKNPHEDNARIQGMLAELRSISVGLYNTLESYLSQWKSDSKPDVSRYLAVFFAVLQQPNVGFGHDGAITIWARDLMK